MKIEKGTNKGRRIHHITKGNIKVSALMVLEPGINRIEKVTILTKEPPQELSLTNTTDCTTIIRALLSLDKDIENQIKRVMIRNEY